MVTVPIKKDRLISIHIWVSHRPMHWSLPLPQYEHSEKAQLTTSVWENQLLQEKSDATLSFRLTMTSSQISSPPFHGAHLSTTFTSHPDTVRHLPTHSRIADGASHRHPFTPISLPVAHLLDGPAARRQLLTYVVLPVPARAARVAPT